MTATVCSDHHNDYDDQCFIIVPSEGNLDMMIKFEKNEMDRRVKVIEVRHPDPGRSVPVACS